MQKTIEPSQYKLLVFDIDGTLLGSSKKITPYSKNILQRLRAQGLSFTLATGKTLPATKDLADELEVDIPLILSNGGMLQTRQGKLFYQECLPRAVVSQSIQVAQSYQCDLVMYINNQLYLLELNDNSRPIYGDVPWGLNEIGAWENITDKFSQVNKCLIVDTRDEQNLNRMDGILRDSLSSQANICRTSPALLEVLPKGVTKASALQRLADQLHISTQAIMAFGDYDNDVEMLASAGLGVAVANASPACLQRANLIIASADEDGPAHFLEGLFLSS